MASSCRTRRRCCRSRPRKWPTPARNSTASSARNRLCNVFGGRPNPAPEFLSSSLKIRIAMSADTRPTTPATAARPSFSSAGRATFDIALRMGGLFAAIIVVAIIIFVLKPSSFNVDVGISVLRAMSSVAIMSLGLTLVIVVGEIDLSFGAMYGLGANVLAVLWLVAGFSVYSSLALAIVAGAILGLFNG